MKNKQFPNLDYSNNKMEIKKLPVPVKCDYQQIATVI